MNSSICAEKMSIGSRTNCDFSAIRSPNPENCPMMRGNSLRIALVFYKKVVLISEVSATRMKASGRLTLDHDHQQPKTNSELKVK